MQAANAAKKLKADCGLEHDSQVTVFSPGSKEIKAIIRYNGCFPQAPEEN